MKVPKKGTCCIHNCPHKGQLMAILGSTPIYYCYNHRDLGGQIINFLITSKISNKITKFLKTVREDIFIKGKIKFSEKSLKEIKQYFKDNGADLDEAERELGFFNGTDYDDSMDYIEVPNK